MDKSARLIIAGRIDMEIAAAARNAAADVFAVVPEIHGEQRLGFAELSDLMIHKFALFRGYKQVRDSFPAHGYIGEKPCKLAAPCDHLVDIFLASDDFGIFAGIAGRKIRRAVFLF
jgi:hypothetical protein